MADQQPSDTCHAAVGVDNPETSQHLSDTLTGKHRKNNEIRQRKQNRHHPTSVTQFAVEKFSAVVAQESAD